MQDWQANRATSMTTAEDRAAKALAMHVASINREAVDADTLARVNVAMQVD